MGPVEVPDEGKVLQARRLAMTLLPYAILFAPFAYALDWVGFRLKPIEMIDAFPYLWRAPISAAYFTGRSLTQRVLFSLCREDPATIAIVQLACAAVAAWCVYEVLSNSGLRVQNILPALVIALLATSFNTTLVAVALVPEPLWLYLAIAFPFVLVLARGRSRSALLLCAGVPFIFSKNVAPAVVLAELGAYALARFPTRELRSRVRFSELLPYGVLVTLALASALVTQTWDTSVALNAANDVFQRILVDGAKTRHFHERHGMPESPHVDELAGHFVNVGLYGRPLYRRDEPSRNYVFLPGDDPLLLWVVHRGFGEYFRHLLLHDPIGTLRDLDRGLSDLYRPSTVTFMSREVQSHAVDRGAARHNAEMLLGQQLPEFDEQSYLAANPDVADAVKQGRIRSGREHYDLYGRAEGRLMGANDPARALPEGLLRFDPIGVLTLVFGRLGLHRLAGLLACMGASLFAARRLRSAPGFVLALVLLAGSFCGIFFGYFGDAMDLDRHVWASVITLTLGLFVLGVASAHCALRRAHSS